MFSGFLRKEREKRGISQERLCRGVCAVSALSRYENGERIPDRLLMNTLIERLGKSSDKLVTMISCQEYAYFEWKSKVKETLRKKNIATLSIHPYLTNLIRNEKLENIEVDKDTVNNYV